MNRNPACFPCIRQNACFDKLHPPGIQVYSGQLKTRENIGALNNLDCVRLHFLFCQRKYVNREILEDSQSYFFIYTHATAFFSVVVDV